MDIEERIVEELSALLNGLAYPTIEAQKRKLGIQGAPLTVEQGRLLIEQIREASVHLAGESAADEMYKRLIRLCNGEKEGER